MVSFMLVIMLIKISRLQWYLLVRYSVCTVLQRRSGLHGLQWHPAAWPGPAGVWSWHIGGVKPDSQVFVSRLSRQDKVKKLKLSKVFWSKLFNYHLLAAARSPYYHQTGDKVKANLGLGVNTAGLSCSAGGDLMNVMELPSPAGSGLVWVILRLPAWDVAWWCEEEAGPAPLARPGSPRGNRQGRVASCPAPPRASSSSASEPQPFSLPPTFASPETWEICCYKSEIWRDRETKFTCSSSVVFS